MKIIYYNNVIPLSHKFPKRQVKVFWISDANMPLQGERNYLSESHLSESIIRAAPLQVISAAKRVQPWQNGKERMSYSLHRSLIHESSALSSRRSPGLFYFQQVLILRVGVPPSETSLPSYPDATKGRALLLPSLLRDR